MRLYTFPTWTRLHYPGAMWEKKSLSRKTLYLTFDDGPDPDTTPWLLDELSYYSANATFFCVGENVERYPDLFERIVGGGHAVGNHTHRHLNGWKTPAFKYIEDVEEANVLINSKLFRPPYGRIRKQQFNRLKKRGFKTVFWSVMSYDFDRELPAEIRLKSIRKNCQNGSVIVFHDSKKAFPQLKKELPVLLEQWQSEGFCFDAIEEN